MISCFSCAWENSVKFQGAYAHLSGLLSVGVAGVHGDVTCVSVHIKSSCISYLYALLYRSIYNETRMELQGVNNDEPWRRGTGRGTSRWAWGCCCWFRLPGSISEIFDKILVVSNIYLNATHKSQSFGVDQFHIFQIPVRGSIHFRSAIVEPTKMCAHLWLSEWYLYI